jgi:gas vesicle protein
MIDTVTETEPDAKPRRWVRAILGLICALIAAMWVYALIFAPKEGVYLVTEKAWRTSAEQICTTAQRQRQALADTDEGYISDPTHEQMMQRADIVDKATDIVEGMLDQIAALPLASDDDRERVAVFMTHYRQIITDRRAYTARLRAFDLQPYRETMVRGGPVTNVVIDFTTGNAIPHCMPPGELGGDM